jgi:subtilisin family serine protease
MSDYIYRLPPYEHGTSVGALTEREWDWWHTGFKFPEANKLSRGQGIIGAILDTGIDASHSDFAGRILEVRDFTGSASGASDRQGHGTWCAGAFGAGEDDKGIQGVAPDSKLLIGKVLGDDGSGRGSWISTGIRWAKSRGAHIISMSLGSPQEDPAITMACREAVNAGIVVVCAAGNDGRPNSVNWPAALPEVIAVGAVDKNGRVASFSSRGEQVDIAGPGVNMLSCWPGGTHKRLSGTSMATPVVAGAIALLLALEKLTPAQVAERLKTFALDVGDPGRDPDYGWGLIRPEDMLGEAPPPPAGEIQIGRHRMVPLTHDGHEGFFCWSE